ncbi:MAG: hypothetical protein ABI311_05825 [Gemmatimonadaceae bacterium]
MTSHGNERRTSAEAELERTLAKLNGRAWGVAMGLILGIVLFGATIILVMKGGEVVGPHLALLGIFLPGYRVTVLGAFIGFIYAFVLGYALGRLVGAVYNVIAAPSKSRGSR